MINAINHMDILMQTWDDGTLGGGLCAGAMCLIWIVPAIIGIVIAIWMYKDAQKRDENAVLWLIVGLVAGIIGLIIWFVVRPDMAEVERKRREKQMGGYPQHQPPQQYGGHQQPPQQQQGRPCPDCGGNMRYVNEYNRWYCDRCQGYK